MQLQVTLKAARGDDCKIHRSESWLGILLGSQTSPSRFGRGQNQQKARLFSPTCSFSWNEEENNLVCFLRNAHFQKQAFGMWSDGRVPTPACIICQQHSQSKCDTEH